MSDSHLESVCERLARQGGQRAWQAFTTGTISSTQKVDSSLVTEWDQNIERELIAQLEAEFPDHSIIGEELPPKVGSGEYTWYLDPIDGTSNFSADVPLFCCMVCVTKGDQVVAASIYITASQKQYTASSDSPTTVNGQPFTLPPLQPQAQQTLLLEGGRTALAKAKVSHLAGLLSQFRSLRKFGTVCGGVAVMFSGQPAVHVVVDANPYDLAPAALLYQQAGWAVFNQHGKPWRVTDRDLIVCHPDQADEFHKLVATSSTIMV